MKNPLAKIFAKFSRKEKAPLPKGEERAIVTPAKINGVTVHEVPEARELVFKNVSLIGADGTPLIDYGSFTLKPGDRMMIKGPAGCGKSAGLAAMRGAWLLGGTGEITVPPEVRFVPQEDYFPDRSLMGMICAPDPVSRFTREDVVKAMTDAGLEDFIDQMDDNSKRGEYWKNTLSGGQKNKVGFAGAFLHAENTKILIVDEITAALDAKSEAALYPKLLERMKHGIVISVAHHSTLAPQHNVFGLVANGKVTYSDTLPAAFAGHDATEAPANSNDAAHPARPPKVAP
ncbi:MAG: ATP-binding cassette domain-containing protein [Alphaproteobacteria bacterium]